MAVGLWLSLSPNGWCRYGTDLLRHWFLSLMKTTCSFRVAHFHTTLYMKDANFSSDTEIVHRIVDSALWGRLPEQNSHRLDRWFYTFGRFSRSSRLLKFPLDGSLSFRRASWWRKGSLLHLSQTQSLFSWGFSGLQTHDDTKTEKVTWNQTFLKRDNGLVSEKTSLVLSLARSSFSIAGLCLVFCMPSCLSCLILASSIWFETTKRGSWVTLIPKRCGGVCRYLSMPFLKDRRVARL